MRSDSSPPCKEGPLPPGEAPPLPSQHPPAKCPNCHWPWTSKRDERGGLCEEGEGGKTEGYCNSGGDNVATVGAEGNFMLYLFVNIIHQSHNVMTALICYFVVLTTSLYH